MMGTGQKNDNNNDHFSDVITSQQIKMHVHHSPLLT
jgi:hypothetical protein